MQVWFTSDPHFGHTNVLKYCNRPYKDTDEMHESMIAKWNGRVGPDDVVWMLGDIFFCGEDEAVEILSRLNGAKHLLLGNHDKRIRNSKKIQGMFTEIYPDLHSTYINGQYVVMCHYPLLSWDRAFHGSYMLHGHCHGTIPFDPRYRRLDVGADCWNYAPVSWSDVSRKLNAIDPKDTRERER